MAKRHWQKPSNSKEGPQCIMPPARKNLKEILISRVTGQLCMQWKQFSKGYYAIEAHEYSTFLGLCRLINCFWYCLKPRKTEWQIKEIQLPEPKRLPSFHDITEKLTDKPWLIILFCINFCKITTRFLFFPSLMAKSNCNMVLNPRQKPTLVLNIQLERLTLSCSTQLSTSRFNIQS